MLTILTRAEYDASPQDLKDAIDKVRRRYAGYLRDSAPEACATVSDDELVDSVTYLHELGFLGMVYNEGESAIRVVACLPCLDGVHTEQCTTLEQWTIYGELIEKLKEG